MKLYIIILKKKNASILHEKNRGLWIGIESSYHSARNKAITIFPTKEPIFYSAMSLKELIYLLPFINGKQKGLVT